MRNLKKVLALALATVMLLGMMAMASAADFADEAQIADQYDAAVDVMQAIGVFNGSKGYLNPKSTLTRAEAAKVITYLAITKTNADKLGTAEAPFADVEADNWAAGSIAYAKQLGIVSGKGDNKYDPAGTLTGYEFAKMLLVVLGYKAENQGYKGAAWSNNVNLDALTAGLLKGLNIDLGANILREEAAQMAFNALNAKIAYYAGNTSITIGDATIAVGGSVQLKNQTFAQANYPTLVLSTAYDNDFGYNVKSWYYNAKKVATQPDYTVVASFPGTAATLTQGAVYNLFAADTTMNIYANGADAGIDLVGDEGFTTNAGLAAYAGATVEIVKNNDGTKETIVKVATPAKVTKVVAATATAKRYVEVDTDLNGTYDKTITTEAYEAGQYILVYLKADGTIIAHEAAQTVYGTMTQVGKNAAGTAVTSLYLDGTAIPAAGAGSNGIANFAGALNKKYTVVLTNGYAAYTKADSAKASLDNVAYIYAGGTPKDIYGADCTYDLANVIYMDGTKADVKLEAGAYVGAGLYKLTDADADGLKEIVDMTTLDASATVPYGAFAWAGATKTATTKSIVEGTDKAYLAADDQVLTITTKAGVTTGAVSTMPAAATFGSSIVIYSYNATAGVNEVEMVITFANPAPTAADLYYVIGNEVGKVYVAAADKTYAQYVAYDVATGEKKTVMVSAPVATGFKSYTVDANGVYTFAAPVYGTNVAVDVTAAQTVDVYNSLLTVSGTAIADYDAAATVIIDAKGTAVKTLADLNKKDDTAVFSAIYNTANGGKVIAIVVTAY